MFCSVLSSIRIAKIPNNLCKKIITVSLQHKLLSSKTKHEVPLKSEEGDQKKPKRSIIPRITLIIGENINITTLDEAQKLSKRRDLKLVKLVDLDTKTQRPIYKLMTGAEYHVEDLKQREQKRKVRQDAFKGEKILIMSSNISEHDLNTQANKMLKWIGKKYEIRVVINGDASHMEKAERVYTFLENHVQNEGKVVQKRTKGSDVKFQVLPPKKDETNSENS